MSGSSSELYDRSKGQDGFLRVSYAESYGHQLGTKRVIRKGEGKLDYHSHTQPLPPPKKNLFAAFLHGSKEWDRGISSDLQR